MSIFSCMLTTLSLDIESSHSWHKTLPINRLLTWITWQSQPLQLSESSWSWRMVAPTAEAIWGIPPLYSIETFKLRPNTSTNPIQTCIKIQFKCISKTNWNAALNPNQSLRWSWAEVDTGYEQMFEMTLSTSAAVHSAICKLKNSWRRWQMGEIRWHSLWLSFLYTTDCFGSRTFSREGERIPRIIKPDKITVVIPR